jgi:hypothetical protein
MIFTLAMLNAKTLFALQSVKQWQQSARRVQSYVRWLKMMTFTLVANMPLLSAQGGKVEI